MDAGAAGDLFGRYDLGVRPGGGYLRITALDDETGQPSPARALISAVSPTRQLRFDIGQNGMHVNGEFGIPIAPGVVDPE